MTHPKQTTDPIATEFDAQFLHNFGDIDPIPIGAIALCGAISTSTGSGQIEPLKVECCPICVALTQQPEDQP
jgi:hypothetical protein